MLCLITLIVDNLLFKLNMVVLYVKNISMESRLMKIFLKYQQQHSMQKLNKLLLILIQATQLQKKI